MLSMRYLSDVVTLQLDTTKCIGCGMCTTVCPHKVFRVEDGKACIVDRDGCMECGACQRNCPTEAIRVDPGVGCAVGLLRSFLCGGEPSCDCQNGNSCC